MDTTLSQSKETEPCESPASGSAMTPTHQSIGTGRGAFLTRVTLGLFGVWFAARLFLFRHPFSGDDICHFMIARDALVEPRLFLHIWGRPGFTLLHALPAQLGFDVTRVVSGLMSISAALLVREVLRPRGGLIAALGLGFCLFQSVFLQLADGALTETAHALALALGLALLAKDRLGWAALAFSYTAICRLEGLAFLPIFAVALVLRASHRPHPRRNGVCLVLLTGVFPLAWNCLCSWDTGFTRLLPIWTENQFVQAPDAYYGKGPWWDFALQSPMMHTPLVALLLIPGVLRSLRARAALVPVYVLAFYAVQSTLWAGGWFRTAGYDRFFASIAPAVAILAALGADTLLRTLARTQCRQRLQVVAGILLAVTVVWSVIDTSVRRRFFEQDYEAVARGVARIQALGGVSESARMLSPSMYPQLLLDIGPYRRDLLIPWTKTDLEFAPKGAFLLFVGHRPAAFENTPDRIHALDLFAPSERERWAERIQAGKSFIHLLEAPREGLEFLGDFSVVGRTPFFGIDDDPYPVFVKLLRVAVDPPQRPAAAPSFAPSYVWAR